MTRWQQTPRRRNPQWLSRARGRQVGVIAACMIVAGLNSGLARADTLTPAVGGASLSRDGVVVDTVGSAPPLPTVDATSFVVADLASGDVLAAKSAHERLPTASTLKMLTADVLLPRLDLGAMYVGTDADAMAEGSKVGVDPGLTYTVDQLFQGMLLMSGNDAAEALAGIAGGQAMTVRLMNTRAAAIHASDTSVVNVTGLDAPGQLSSAYDLALIARDAMKDPAFRAYVSQRVGQFPSRDGGTYEIQNLNRLLGSYDGDIGIKTGFTTLARTTYAGAATRDGHTFLVTVMHVEGRGEVPAAALLDWAFAASGKVTPVGTLVDPGETVSDPPTPQSTGAAKADPNSHALAQSTAEPAAPVELSPSSGHGVVRGAGALLGVVTGTAVALRLRARRSQRTRRR